MPMPPPSAPTPPQDRKSRNAARRAEPGLLPHRGSSLRRAAEDVILDPMLRGAATSLLLCACSIPAIDLSGNACPCPTPYVCEPSRNTCALGSSRDAQTDASLSTCAIDVSAHTSNTCGIR